MSSYLLLIGQSLFQHGASHPFSLVKLKQDTVGEQIQAKICRACGHWVGGDQPEFNARFGRQLIGNVLA